MLHTPPMLALLHIVFTQYSHDGPKYDGTEQNLQKILPKQYCSFTQSHVQPPKDVGCLIHKHKERRPDKTDDHSTPGCLNLPIRDHYRCLLVCARTQDLQLG